MRLLASSGIFIEGLTIFTIRLLLGRLLVGRLAVSAPQKTHGFFAWETLFLCFGDFVYLCWNF